MAKSKVTEAVEKEITKEGLPREAFANGHPYFSIKTTDAVNKAFCIAYLHMA